jgi:hypothetical protein
MRLEPQTSLRQQSLKTNRGGSPSPAKKCVWKVWDEDEEHDCRASGGGPFVGKHDGRLPLAGNNKSTL